MKKYDYVVYVDDNFHYMDEDERYKLGEFSEWGIYLTQVAPRCSMWCDGGLSAELG